MSGLGVPLETESDEVKSDCFNTTEIPLPIFLARSDGGQSTFNISIGGATLKPVFDLGSTYTFLQSEDRASVILGNTYEFAYGSGIIEGRVVFGALEWSGTQRYFPYYNVTNASAFEDLNVVGADHSSAFLAVLFKLYNMSHSFLFKYNADEKIVKFTRTQFTRHGQASIANILPKNHRIIENTPTHNPSKNATIADWWQFQVKIDGLPDQQAFVDSTASTFLSSSVILHYNLTVNKSVECFTLPNITLHVTTGMLIIRPEAYSRPDVTDYCYLQPHVL